MRVKTQDCPLKAIPFGQSPGIYQTSAINSASLNTEVVTGSEDKERAGRIVGGRRIAELGRAVTLVYQSDRVTLTNQGSTTFFSPSEHILFLCEEIFYIWHDVFIRITGLTSGAEAPVQPPSTHDLKRG